jgi:hypothetical protein
VVFSAMLAAGLFIGRSSRAGYGAKQHEENEELYDEQTQPTDRPSEVYEPAGYGSAPETGGQP